jgi:hypothetical protein
MRDDVDYRAEKKKTAKMLLAIIESDADEETRLRLTENALKKMPRRIRRRFRPSIMLWRLRFTNERPAGALTPGEPTTRTPVKEIEDARSSI